MAKQPKDGTGSGQLEDEGARPESPKMAAFTQGVSKSSAMREFAVRDNAPKGRPRDRREQNIQLFQRYIELENKRDYKNLEKLFHPTEFVCHTWFGRHPIKPQALTRMLRGLFRAFPDWYMTINEIIAADDDCVAGRITGRGTQAEEFMGRPPSDQQIAIPLVHTIRVADGKIVAYRATNPFDDPFQADVTGADDVQEVRATQGLDSRKTDRAVAVTAAMTAAGAKVENEAVRRLEAEAEAERNLCQALLKKNMRRCTMPAVKGSIYCTHHNKHGYGVDGIE